MKVDLPGIYVDRIVPATVAKEIEIVRLHRATAADSSEESEAQRRRERIARRAAKELNDGDYCNLGVGIPTLAANYRCTSMAAIGEWHIRNGPLSPGE